MERDSGAPSMLHISKKTFISSILILLALMIAAYALTFILPSGEYERTVGDGGEELIVEGTYRLTEGGIPLWKWLLSPFLALGAKGGTTIIAICVFLLVIGGAFTALDDCGMMRYMLGSLQSRFNSRKYLLLALMCLFFMALGAMVGSFEEVVPLVPIAVALAYCLGWDALVGLGMSILAVCCGFATGVCNVFTVGVAQRLAGLPIFSGLSFRILTFLVIYPLLYWFLRVYAKRIEKDPEKSAVYDPEMNARWRQAGAVFERSAKMSRALTAFAIVLGAIVLVIVCSTFLTGLQDYLMVIVALLFLTAGTTSVLLSGYGLKHYLRTFGKGILNFLPALLMILMASSVRYTMEQGKILDTILYYATGWAVGKPTGTVALLIYALVLVMNFFIGSASAKAFLLMPLIAPLATLCGVSRQVAVLAFAYGDGFSNIFYPTNAVLLISLGFAGVSYGKWARWSAKLQIPILLITAALLLLANAAGYNLI